MRGVLCNADATFDVGWGVLVLSLGITARGFLIEKKVYAAMD